MIHHISIAVRNPLRVAQVLAELWQGDITPIPECTGGYVVLAYDHYGTAMLILPKDTEIRPGTAEAMGEFVYNPQISPYTATHAAISVSIDEATIRAVGKREGWQVKRCDHQGYFEVIELWIENQVLIELLTPEIAPKYLDFMQPDSLKQFVAMAS
jgi:hypothetical protein